MLYAIRYIIFIVIILISLLSQNRASNNCECIDRITTDSCMGICPSYFSKKLNTSVSYEGFLSLFPLEPSDPDNIATAILPNGDKYLTRWYKGDISSGADCDNGIIFPNVILYSGGLFWDDANQQISFRFFGSCGRGRMMYANGDMYNGVWVKNKKYGEGKIEYENGDEYNGTWIDDKKHGKGKMVYTNGDEYNGIWIDDKKHGKGIMYSHESNTYYEGEFKEGMKDGIGTIKEGWFWPTTYNVKCVGDKCTG